MAFIHQPVDLDQITNDDTENGRYYTTPGGVFPSVTTVIGRYKGGAELDEWRRRVGEDEARKVGTRARVRGTAVHAIAEAYMKNEEDWAKGRMPVNLDSFMSIKPILDSHVGTVYGVEVPLWSDILRTAGRTDLWADWDGVRSIIDFKTSLRVKKEEKIWGYFVQKSCYSRMVEERTGIEVPQIVTVMMIDNEPPAIWVKRREEFDGDVERVFISSRED